MASANTSNQTSPVLSPTPHGSTNEAPILAPPTNSTLAPTTPNESKATDYVPTWAKYLLVVIL